jgi:predicted PurR-regulated permease PerM
MARRTPVLKADDVVRWGAAGAALILLGFLLFSLHEVLNPPLLFLALVGALFPLRRSPGFLAIVLTAGGLTLFWLLREMGFLLAPFVLAIVLAYILNPAVNRLAAIRPLRRFDERWQGLRVGRTGAILLLALPVAGGSLALLIWGVPYLAGELQGIARRTPELLERLANSIEGLSGRLGAISFPGFDGGAFAQRVAELDADAVVRFFEDRREVLQQWVWEGVLGLGRGLGTALSMLGYLVLAPILIFYLLRDYDRLLDRLSTLIPPGREGVRKGFREYDRLLAAYLRGQVTVSISVGLLTTVGLLMTGFPYAFLLGAIVAVFNIVPYLGLVLSLIPAVAIALTGGDPGVDLIKMGLVYGIAQTLESAVISPRIVGDSTGLHPVWILFAIAVSGFFFGFVGLLIAVPLAVGVKLLVSLGMERYRSSPLFDEAA